MSRTLILAIVTFLLFPAFLSLATDGDLDAPSIPSHTAAVAADGQLSDAERQELLQLLGGTGKEVITTVAALDDAAWSYKPTPDRWSIAQIVEHLLVVEQGLRAQVEEAMTNAPDTEWAAKTAEKTAVLRATLADHSQKFQAPEPVQPKGEMTRRQVVEGFATTRQQTMALVRETKVPLHAQTYESFAFNTLNAHQGLLVVALHNQRHLKQIKDVLAEPSFPG